MSTSPIIRVAGNVGTFTSHESGCVFTLTPLSWDDDVERNAYFDCYSSEQLELHEGDQVTIEGDFLYEVSFYYQDVELSITNARKVEP